MFPFFGIIFESKIFNLYPILKCKTIRHSVIIFSGQILNRFSRDIFQMDDELPWKSFDAVNVKIFPYILHWNPVVHIVWTRLLSYHI